MVLHADTRLKSGGEDLELSPDKFGELRSSGDIQDDLEALQNRMNEDGYLYLPGYLNRNEVLGVKQTIVAGLAREGFLSEGYPMEEVVAKPDLKLYFKPDLAKGNQALEALIYGPRMLSFYEGLLGGAVRHYDYTWLRAVAPGCGTSPHCDIVYMGRGTPNLYTAWIPLGDVPLQVGGLIVLENSHKLDGLRQTYGKLDVDSVCSNEAGQTPLEKGGWSKHGHLNATAPQIRDQLGGRWLTAEFKAGDLLTFSMFTVHASLDNASNIIRLSSDSRYQLACEPVDERWVGENPIGHGENARKELIC